MIDFLNPLTAAMISGLGVAMISGYLGVFVISQRLSFFSDALAHAALLGISVSVIFTLDVNISFVVTALVFACFFSYLLSYSNVSSDTLIGILAHSFLAISLLSISLFSNRRIDLEHYLIGDLSSVSWENVIWIGLCGVIAAIFLFKNWNRLILLSLHEEIAQVEGIDTQKLRLGLTLVLALLVAVSIQLIGALLISALLIIPASAARQWSSSVATMGFIASKIASISVLVGLLFSYQFNTPSGPSIVVIASMIFVLSITLRNFKKNTI